MPQVLKNKANFQGELWRISNYRIAAKSSVLFKPWMRLLKAKTASCRLKLSVRKLPIFIPDAFRLFFEFQLLLIKICCCAVVVNIHHACTSNEDISIDMEVIYIMNALYTNYQFISLSSSNCKCGRHITTLTISHDICNTLCNCMKLSYKLNAKIELTQTHTCRYFSNISGHLVDYFSHQSQIW
jgi:hypothetical protein